MFTNLKSDVIITTLLIVELLLIILTGTVIFLDRNKCTQEASMVHMKTSWGFFEGCTIRLKDGQTLTQTQFDSFYKTK